MSALEVLKKAYSLIEDEAHWCRVAFARDASGEATGIHDDDAVSFCALGAVNRAIRDTGLVKYDNGRIYAKIVKALQAAADGPITQVNDNQGHSEVLQAFRTAISTLEVER